MCGILNGRKYSFKKTVTYSHIIRIHKYKKKRPICIRMFRIIRIRKKCVENLFIYVITSNPARIMGRPVNESFELRREHVTYMDE